MKKIVLASLMMVCLPYLAMAQSVDDDLYFIPKKKTEKKEEVKKEVKVVVPQKQNTTTVYAAPGSTVVVKDVKGKVRDVDEYNRRYTSRENNFSMENDTLYIEEKPLNERGEWINGFEGSQDDYEYAMRIVRFRNPRYAIPVSSPLYWDVVYGAYPSWDWNVYDDGLYAYAFPTYTNRLWWDWRFNYPYGGGWGMSWGWSSPWYYNSWYGPGYWGGGYWGGYWGHYHNHYYPHYGWGGGHWVGGGHGHGWSRPSYDTRRAERSRGNSFIGSGSSNRETGRYNTGRVNRSSYRSSANNRVAGRVVNSDRVSSSVRPNRGTASRGDVTTGTNNAYRGDRPRPSTSYTRPSMSNRGESNYTRPSSTRSSVRNNGSGSTYQRSSAVNRSSDYNRSNRSSYNSNRSNSYNSTRSSSSSSRSSYSSGSSSRSSYSSGSSGSSTRSSGGGGGARRR